MRIHLAGTELLHYLKMVNETGHKHVLFSYYHFHKNSPKDMKRVIDYFNHNNMNVIIDSGLFTFMFGSGKGKIYSYEAMEQYALKYIENVKSYGISNIIMVECDVHKILNMESVFKLRRLFEKSGIETIYVWHIEEGIDGLIKMASKYNYIALSVPELRILFKGKESRYQHAVFDLLNKIKKDTKKLPKIHLLGNTVEETMKTHLAYSCDSTSYLSGVKYGNGMIYNYGKLSKIHIRSKAWAQLKEITFNKYKSVCSIIDKQSERPKFRDYNRNVFLCAMAYYQYQEWLDKNFQWIGTNG